MWLNQVLNATQVYPVGSLCYKMLAALGLSSIGQYRKYLVAFVPGFCWAGGIPRGLDFLLFLSKKLNSGNSTEGALGLSSSSKAELYAKALWGKGPG